MAARPRRRVAAILLAGAVAAATASLPAARADNVVVAINTKDGSTLFRSALSIRRVMGDVVDEGNAAVAFASCDACETIAVALQVVLVMSDPSVVTPTNLALAINQGCTSCETLASAYQLVLGTGGPVHFTADGNRRLAELRQELLALRDATDLSPAELQAEIEHLTTELAQVVADELVPAGPPPEQAPPPSTTTTTEDDGGPTTTAPDGEPSSTTTSPTTTSTSTSTTSP